MEFDSVIAHRRSIRSFTSKKVNWKYVIDVIESANKNPFAGNFNNLKYLIIKSNTTINKIAKLADQLWISESNMVLIVCSDDSYLESLYGERGRVYSRQQAGAVIQTILFKLTDLNLSSCWVGAYTDETIKQILKIPKNIQIEAIIPIGYSSTRTLKKRKNKPENSVYWELWHESKKPVKYPKEQEEEFALKK